MIDRHTYLKRIIGKMWNGQIKVITGIRRCGKSTLLFDIFYKHLIENGISKNNIIRIQLDQRKFFELRDPISLCDYVENIIKNKTDKQFYLFIDEVQFTTKIKHKSNDNIELTIYDMLNELKSYKNLDIYVTGSNSKGLSKDIATEFRGRASQIRVHPLSFAEYCQAFNDDPEALLEEYMLYGGMPDCASLTTSQEKSEYLNSLINELYLKDIMDRNQIDRPEILGQILDYLSSQIGSLSNANNIANSITSASKGKVSSSLVARYIEYLEDSFLVSEAKRYDIKGKHYFTYPMKYYFEDIGLRNAKLNFRQYDPGHIMENLIYNELNIRGFNVDVGVVLDRSNNLNRQKEIDFVVNNINKKAYIQCALQFSSTEKQDSELGSLRLTDDFFKKTIIRNDIHHSFFDNDGIHHISLIDFLLNKEDIF